MFYMNKITKCYLHVTCYSLFAFHLRIMVLKDGSIAEFDSPSDLLSRRGLFYVMARDAGLA